MDRYDAGASFRDPPMPAECLEVWVAGPPSDVDAVLAALGGIGHVAFAGRATRMFGPDTGRVHRYIRVMSTTATVTTRPTSTRREPAGQSVIDLDAARAKRTA